MDKASVCPFYDKRCPAVDETADWICPLVIKRHEHSTATCALFEIAAQVMRMGDYMFDITNKYKGS